MTPYESKDLCDGDGNLTEADRKEIIGRIHSLVYWVGKLIPEEYEVGGRVIELRNVVYNYIDKQNPTEKDREDALALAEALKIRAEELESEIKSDELTRPHACEIMNEIRGILRAVDDLRFVGGKEAGIKRIELLKKVNDAKRWEKFVKNCQGTVVRKLTDLQTPDTEIVSSSSDKKKLVSCFRRRFFRSHKS